MRKSSVADIAQLLAHRIRSLTTCIEAYGDLLGATLNEPEQRDLLFRVFETTARIEHILSDLLLFSRPVQASFETITIAGILENLRTTVGDTFDDRIEVVRSVDAATEVRCDERLLRQALLALIKNAIEASPRGARVYLKIERESRGPTIVFSLQNEGSLGHGADEQLVFEPFYSTRSQNLGLGLPIARRIANDHGGDIVFLVDENVPVVQVSLRIPIEPGEGLRGHIG